VVLLSLPVGSLGVPSETEGKVTLPSAEVLLLTKLLWRESVTPAHLMPTFDHIKRALEMEAGWSAAASGDALDVVPPAP
jgi:hypothetical protein